jgi:HrpA-like RNA helicase
MSLILENVRKGDILRRILVVIVDVFIRTTDSVDDRAFEGFDTLMVRDITKSSAMQRMGRAGREVWFYLFSWTQMCLTCIQGEGSCFRLYTEDAFNSMALSSEPEIRRCSLASAFLELKRLGVDMEELEFMDKPDIDSGQSFVTYM